MEVLKQPLTDADRWDWLIRIREHALDICRGLKPTPPKPANIQNAASPVGLNLETDMGAVVTCSALKLKYRDEFRIATHPSKYPGPLSVYFIYLSLSESELRNRVAARKNHYMSEEMVASQIASLERPSEREQREDVIYVDASGSPEDVFTAVMDGVREKLDNEEEDLSWESRCEA